MEERASFRTEDGEGNIVAREEGGNSSSQGKTEIVQSPPAFAGKEASAGGVMRQLTVKKRGGRKNGEAKEESRPLSLSARSDGKPPQEKAVVDEGLGAFTNDSSSNTRAANDSEAVHVVRGRGDKQLQVVSRSRNRAQKSSSSSSSPSSGLTAVPNSPRGENTEAPQFTEEGRSIGVADKEEEQRQEAAAAGGDEVQGKATGESQKHPTGAPLPPPSPYQVQSQILSAAVIGTSPTLTTALTVSLATTGSLSTSTSGPPSSPPPPPAPEAEAEAEAEVKSGRKRALEPLPEEVLADDYHNFGYHIISEGPTITLDFTNDPRVRAIQEEYDEEWLDVHLGNEEGYTRIKGDEEVPIEVPPLKKRRLDYQFKKDSLTAELGTLFSSVPRPSPSSSSSSSSSSSPTVRFYPLPRVRILDFSAKLGKEEEDDVTLTYLMVNPEWVRLIGFRKSMALARAWYKLVLRHRSLDVAMDFSATMLDRLEGNGGAGAGGGKESPWTKEGLLDKPYNLETGIEVEILKFERVGGKGELPEGLSLNKMYNYGRIIKVELVKMNWLYVTVSFHKHPGRTEVLVIDLFLKEPIADLLRAPTNLSWKEKKGHYVPIK